MKASRADAGPDFDLMVDLVQGSTPRPWPAATVFEVASALQPDRPAFFEEPFPVEDLRAHRDLSARVPYAIAGGEGIRSLADAQDFLRDRPFDYLQPDASITGGITACRRIGILAEAQQVRVAGLSWGVGVSMMANLQFALANPSSAMIETCWMLSLFREALYVEPLRMVNGCIQPPVAPGLGIDLGDAILDRYAYTGKAGHRFDWQPVIMSAGQTTGEENATLHPASNNF
jgi:L-alanine-DL-glutamate epimerase-like enolase superfamily enzyme